MMAGPMAMNRRGPIRAARAPTRDDPSMSRNAPGTEMKPAAAAEYASVPWVKIDC